MLLSTGGVSHGATFRPGAVSGSWVTLSGSGLAAATRTWRTSDFITPGRLPESLDGVSVRIHNQPAPVYYVSPTQLNGLAPDNTTEGNVQVTVTNAQGTSDPVTVAFARIAPGFFQFPGENVAAVRPGGVLIGPPRLIDGVTTVPAAPGDTIQLYGTGFGPTTPGVAAGAIVESPARTATPVTVRIDAQDARITWAGLTSSGLYQVNLEVPAGRASGDYAVTAEVGGVRTAKFVKLSVARPPSAAAAVPAPLLTAGEKRQYMALVRRIRNHS